MCCSLCLLPLGPAFSALPSAAQLVRNRKHSLPGEAESWDCTGQQRASGITWLIPSDGNIQSITGRICASDGPLSLGGFLPASRSEPASKHPRTERKVCGDLPLLPDNLGEGAEGSRGLLGKINNSGKLDGIMGVG